MFEKQSNLASEAGIRDDGDMVITHHSPVQLRIRLSVLPRKRLKVTLLLLCVSLVSNVFEVIRLRHTAELFHPRRVQTLGHNHAVATFHLD